MKDRSYLKINKSIALSLWNGLLTCTMNQQNTVAGKHDLCVNPNNLTTLPVTHLSIKSHELTPNTHTHTYPTIHSSKGFFIDHHKNPPIQPSIQHLIPPPTYPPPLHIYLSIHPHPPQIIHSKTPTATSILRWSPCESAIVTYTTLVPSTVRFTQKLPVPPCKVPATIHQSHSAVPLKHS